MLTIVGIIIFKAMKGNVSPAQEEEIIPELPQSQWPAVFLIPTNNPSVNGSDGHWLDFKVQKINVPKAVSMDYLLVYSTSDGGQQGVPGTIKLTGRDVERKLLLGSESSGKFRYDAGVENGTMTITFRNGNGKSVGKLSTDFHLQSETTALTSVDGKFTYTLDKITKGVFFVTMPTFVQPDSSMYTTWSNGYGVFASDGKPHSGK
ncbi:MAG: hypothetical protein UT17_C0004G0106 [Candidatus Woesebacteria bacterium GW2011_GWB1_39_10]|uniref:Uncharacterized protein n=1 Tax=Candidatus Woesebacteria bacterium GW2011_GWB1_39_10 TaxID=1618572 RepID=A0A0G0LIP7_9BACT|nr:MAG: hypothetical protein UT17_C0004G0106 [Candidatus Woesebacteria bacterium GW2011_GWB1_39_10]